MTVKEAFEKAFGPLPEGVTECFIGASLWTDVNEIKPSVLSGNRPFGWSPSCVVHGKPFPGCWCDDSEFMLGPNIADRPASSFCGFFGDEYDRVVEEG